MKPWLLAASALLALSPLQAGAATATEPVNIGQMVDFLNTSLAERCRATPESEILNHGLSCTCGPQALAIAYPASTRTGSAPRGAILARMSGALDACIARTVKQIIADPCSRGIDPFVDDKSPSPPALAAARCQCAAAELDKAAARDPVKDADAASARFAAGQTTVAAPTGVLKAVEAACMKAR